MTKSLKLAGIAVLLAVAGGAQAGIVSDLGFITAPDDKHIGNVFTEPGSASTNADDVDTYLFSLTNDAAGTGFTIEWDALLFDKGPLSLTDVALFSLVDGIVDTEWNSWRGVSDFDFGGLTAGDYVLFLTWDISDLVGTRLLPSVGYAGSLKFASAVPEPGTLALLGLGLMGLGLVRRRAKA